MMIIIEVTSGLLKLYHLPKYFSCFDSKYTQKKVVKGVYDM